MEISIVQETMSLFNQKFDSCAKHSASDISSDLIKTSMALFGIPPKCPITKTGIFCYHEKVFTHSKAIVRLMKLLPDATKIRIRVNITHNSGNSCFEGEARITRKGL